MDEPSSLPATTREELLVLTGRIVASYVGANSLPASELPALIAPVSASLAQQAGAPEPAQAPREPAVPIKRSVTPEYLVCLEDGRKVTMLKRHLRTRYGLTPDEYRARWELPADYPMVAPNYAARRSEFAKQIGLGGKRTERAPEPAPPAPKRRSRKAG